MGMTIDDCIKMLIAKEKCMERETSGTDTDCNFHNCDDCSMCYEQGTMGEQEEALKFAVETMRKYQRFQADYKARLKADMVAMLTEIQLEMEENTVRWYVGRVDGKSDDVVLMETINDIIQQKINTLKENEDGTDEQKEATNEMP